jgi:hypothetical protein
MSLKKDKPEVTKSIMLSLLSGSKLEVSTLKQQHPQINIKNLKTYILPLANFELEFYEDESHLFLPKPKDLDVKEGVFSFGLVSITDDPRVEWAGDWSDMGNFRLVYKFLNPKVEVTENSIKITFKLEEHGKDIWTPDKVRWDGNDR